MCVMNINNHDLDKTLYITGRYSLIHTEYVVISKTTVH